MPLPIIPRRGEVVWVDFDPVEGHEQGGRRPALVLSSDYVNRSPAELVTVIPITTTDRRLRSYVRIDPPEAGVRRTSFIITDQVRTVSRTRVRGVLGLVSRATLADVEDRVRMFLEL